MVHPKNNDKKSMTTPKINSTHMIDKQTDKQTSKQKKTNKTSKPNKQTNNTTHVIGFTQ